MIGKAGVPDAILSIRSFLRNAGIPEKILIISDGTLDKSDRHLFTSGLPNCEVCAIPKALSPHVPRFISNRINDHWMMAKQAVLMSLPYCRPALFADSDVVFFSGAAAIPGLIGEWGRSLAYMVDVGPYLDEHLMRPSDSLSPPLNSGFLYFGTEPDWDDAAVRFAARPTNLPLKFTDQTLSHLAFHQSSAIALDSSQFVLRDDDQFHLRDRSASTAGVVCRHYVGTVRHKMWLL